MGRFSFLQTETLYYRRPTGTLPTGAFSQGDPTYGDPIAFKAAFEQTGGRPPVEQGKTNLLGASVETYTEIRETDLVFPFGDDGSSLSTGRHPQNIRIVPPSRHLDSETLYGFDL